jgi:hypothetical protein
MLNQLMVRNALVPAVTFSLAATLAAASLQIERTQPVQHSKATLAGPVTWGSPDQPYGKRRPVAAADRAAIQSYRSGRKPPIFSTNFTDAAELQADWNLVSDDNQWGGFQSCRRPGNVEASSVSLRLKTLVATDCHHKWSTGYINSKAKYSYGFFEATMKIANIKGMNNAFWMTTEDHPETGDHFEIDVSEVQYPSYDVMTTSVCSNTRPKATKLLSIVVWDGAPSSLTTSRPVSMTTAYFGLPRR